MYHGYLVIGHYIYGLVLVSTVNSCSTFHSLFLHEFQEQIAACHEFDGVRKEKERLTAALIEFYHFHGIYLDPNNRNPDIDNIIDNKIHIRRK